MSLKAHSLPEVPAETKRIAKAVFPKGNVCLTIRDRLGIVYRDEQFQGLFSEEGRPAESAWRLVIISILQFMEDLSDRQAAEAVRARIDWKYLLSLDLEDTGFHYSVLSEFRGRLVEGGVEQVLLDSLLSHLKARGLVKERGSQRTDSTHVLGAIRAMNRVECVGETFRYTLNTLAEVAPDWLRAHGQADWIERYGDRLDDYRLPKQEKARLAYAEIIGADGQVLLEAVDADPTHTWLSHLPAIQTLRRDWDQNYRWAEGRRQWRSATELPPAGEFISSPYDVDAHYSQKRSTSWVGYKVHLTETCDPDLPEIITHVETTSAPTSDDAVVDTIHQDLADKGLLPHTHFVDTGYVSAPQLVNSQTEYQVDLYGPTRGDTRWQAQAGQGFAASDFTIDFQQQQATCPGGHTTSSWTPVLDHGTQPVIKIKFSRTDCRACPLHAHCTQDQRRTITIRPDGQFQALQAARQREQTDTFKEQYTRRAGVEATISQGVRAFGLRRSRYFGQPKTHLQHVLIAIAINLARLVHWFQGDLREETRQARFVRVLQPGAA
jgi:transposase